MIIPKSTSAGGSIKKLTFSPPLNRINSMNRRLQFLFVHKFYIKFSPICNAYYASLPLLTFLLYPIQTETESVKKWFGFGDKILTPNARACLHKLINFRLKISYSFQIAIRSNACVPMILCYAGFWFLLRLCFGHCGSQNLD